MMRADGADGANGSSTTMMVARLSVAPHTLDATARTIAPARVDDVWKWNPSNHS